MKNASDYLEKGLNISIDNSIADIINKETTLLKFPKRYIVLLEGVKSKNLYFIIKGIVRGYYIDENGNDITKCFSSENEFFSSEGLRTSESSSFTIECLEDCFCAMLPYELVDSIINKDKNIGKFFIKYNQKEVGKLETRVKNMSVMTAKERYVDFCIQYPQLHDRVDLKYIASYIGIRSASLSRIRKELQ